METRLDTDLRNVPIQPVPVVENQILYSVLAENGWLVLKCKNTSQNPIHTVIGYGRTGTLYVGVGKTEVEEPPLEVMGYLYGGNEGNHLIIRYDMPVSADVYTFAIKSGSTGKFWLKTVSRFGSVVDAFCYYEFSANPRLFGNTAVEYFAAGSVHNGTQWFEKLSFAGRNHPTQAVQADSVRVPNIGTLPETLDSKDLVEGRLRSSGGAQSNMTLLVTPKQTGRAATNES